MGILGRSLVISIGTLSKENKPILEKLRYNKKIKEMGIIVPSEMYFSNFVKKLEAIDSIYNDLCVLTGVPVTEYPAEISNIKSGSLVAKILGHSKVISIFESILKSGASYIYKKYTDDGKLSELPKDIDNINSILNLKKNLEEQGFNTENLDDSINMYSGVLSLKLNTLLSGEREVIVNEKRLALTHQPKAKNTLYGENNGNNSGLQEMAKDVVRTK